MANKFWDTIKGIFKKPSNNENSTGTTTSAAPASAQPVAQPTTTQPAQQAPVYRDNTVVRKNEQGNGGLYQYKATEQFKNANEVNQQYKYATSLGYNKDQALELLKNGTRWKEIALGQHGRPIKSYQGGRYTSQEEIAEQYKLAQSLGMSKQEILSAMQQGTRWMEEPEEEAPKDTNIPENNSWLNKAAVFTMNSGMGAVGDIIGKRGMNAINRKRREAITRQEEETFWGQVRANLMSGDLGQRVALLTGMGILTGDQEQIDKAQQLQAQAAAYQELNQGAMTADLHYDLPDWLDWAEGGVDKVAGWLSKDMAQYLPQFLYQQAASLTPVVANLAATGGTKMNVGQAIGSGIYSYVTMTGSAYNNLVEKGADPATAVTLARDEAIISGLIESADTYRDFTKGVASKLGILKGAEDELVENFGKGLGKGFWEWAKNTESEGREELLQELVTMANERRLAEGNVQGGILDLLDYVLAEAVVQAPDLAKSLYNYIKKNPDGVSENAQRLMESWRGGAVIGGIGGAAGEIAGNVNGTFNRLAANRSLDAIVEGGSADTLASMQDKDLTTVLARAKALKRTDAQQIIQAELNRRAEQTVQPTAETASVDDTGVPLEQATREDLESMVLADGIESLTEDELKKYVQLLQQDIQMLGQNPNANYNVVDGLEEQYNEAIQELSRRQTEAEAMPETKKGEQPSDSDVGDRRQDTVVAGGRGGEPDDSELVRRGSTVRSEEQIRNNEEQANNPAADQGGVSGRVAEAGRQQADQNLEQGKAESRTLRKRLFKRDTGKVKERRLAIQKKFGIDNWARNPEANLDSLNNMRKYCTDAIGKALGSNSSRGRRVVDTWLADTGQLEVLRWGLDDTIGDLSDAQKMDIYRAFASADILASISDSEMDAQTLADILGVSVDDATAILETASQNAVENLTGKAVLNKDGTIRGVNPFVKEDRQAALQSGKDNKLADIAKGQRIEKDTSTLSSKDKYVAEPGDAIVNIGEFDDGTLVYKRGEGHYIVVAKDGTKLGEARGDNALAQATAVARGHSLSYNRASFALFPSGDKPAIVTYKDGSLQLVADENEVFAKKNWMLQQRSAASDVLGVKYQESAKEMLATTDAFEIDMSVKRGTDYISLDNAMDTIRSLVQGAGVEKANSNSGILMKNGRRYMFFGITSNGAKHGKAIMVAADKYKTLREVSLAGLTEDDKLKLNPNKYLTASMTIWSPSNADMGVTVKEALIIADVFTTRQATLNQFMRTDERAGEMNLDRNELIKAFTRTAKRELAEQGADFTDEHAQAIEARVDQLIEQNKVGGMLNIMTDLLMCCTDGTGFINHPDGKSRQFRGPGGFKGQLIGMDFASYFNDLVPLDKSEASEDHIEYKYTTEDGSVFAGIRHILHDGQDKGVEMMDIWGNWRFLNDYKAVLFNSTCKFANQFKDADDFYGKCGKYDLRSIPRENVYGRGVKSGALEGYTTRGLTQILKNQRGYSEELVRSVMAPDLDGVINNIAGNQDAMARLFGVDLHGKPPASTDNKAQFIYAWNKTGAAPFDHSTVKAWVANELGRVVTDAKAGREVFSENNAAYQWIDPDVVGLAHAMTSLVTITNETNKQVTYEVTDNGGLTVNKELIPLKAGQITSTALESGTTAIARSPNTKMSDTQIKQNVHKAIVEKMHEKYGLDKDNIYLAINDTLSLYLDNDYDGDTATVWQGALAQMMNDQRKAIKSRTRPVWKVSVGEDGSVDVVKTETKSRDFGPVMFSHDKGETIDGITMESAAIVETIRRYLVAMSSKNVGTFDKMLDRLSVLPDSAIQNALNKGYFGKAYKGYTVEDIRSLMEARFSVAYVLSIDYAKSGLEFTEFFERVKDTDNMLVAIAKGAGLIPPDADNFVPAYYEDSLNQEKRDEYLKETAKPQKKQAIVKGNNLLEAIAKALPSESEGNMTNYPSWYNTFAEKLGTSKKWQRGLDYTIAMTTPPAVYAQNYPPKFFKEFNDTYRQIMREEGSYEAKRKRVYEQLQKANGLTNRQFTDLLLYTLTKFGGTSEMAINFNQHSIIDPKLASDFDRQCLRDASTNDLITRNLSLIGDYQTVSESIESLGKQIEGISKTLSDTRDKILELNKKRRSMFSAMDTHMLEAANGTVASAIADIDRLENKLEQMRNISTSNFTEQDFQQFKTELRNITEEIDGLYSRMDNTPSVFSDDVSEDIRSAFVDVEKEIRTAWRQVSSYIEALDNLDAAYQDALQEQQRIQNLRNEATGDLTTGINPSEENAAQQQAEQSEEEELPPPPTDEEAPPEQVPPPEPPEPPAPPEPPTQPNETPEPEQNPEPPKAEEPKPKAFGKRRKAIAKAAASIKSISDKFAGSVKGPDNPTDGKIQVRLSAFGDAVTKLMRGGGDISEVYSAYNSLHETQYNNDDVSEEFEDMNDAYRQYKRDPSSDSEERFNAAVEHALSKFVANANNVAENNARITELANGAQKQKGRFGKLGSWFSSYQENAPTVFKHLMGFVKGTEGYKIADRIYKSVSDKMKHFVTAKQTLDAVSNMEGFSELVDGTTTVTLDSIGETISVIDAINLYRQLETVMVTHGDLGDVNGCYLSDGRKIQLTKFNKKLGYNVESAGKVRSELREYFRDKATPVEKAYYNAVSRTFEYFAPEVQRIGKKLNGYVDMIDPSFYSPLFWGQPGENTEQDFNPKEAQLKGSPRYMKARSQTAGGYLNVQSMQSVMDSYITAMSDYVANAELRNDLMLMNDNSKLRNTKTLAEVAGENLGESYARFANNFVKDMTTKSGDEDSLMARMRQRMQRGILIGSPSVMMKQSASLFNAASVIDMRYILQAIGNKEFKQYAKGQATALEYRRITGDFDPTLSETFKNSASKNPIVNWFLHGINKVDYATVRTVWAAANLQVKAEGYDVGSNEYNTRVEELFTEACLTTQPMFDTALRAENARTNKEIIRMMSMFRTQQTQNYNALFTKLGEYNAEGSKESKAAKNAAIRGLAASSVTFAMLKGVSNTLMHKLNKYRDKDDEDKDGNKQEFSTSNIMKRLTIDSVEAVASTMWFGDALSQYLIDLASGGDTKEFYGVSLGPASLVVDTLEAFSSFAEKPSISSFKKFAAYATEMGGIPINNIYNMGNSVLMYYLDATGDNPDDYDDVTKYFDNQLKAQNQLVKAMSKGDSGKANNLWNALQKKYGDSAKSELNKQVRTDYERGNINANVAQNLLIMYGGLEDEDAAAKRVAKWDFDKAHPEYSDLSEGYVKKWNEVVQPTGVDLNTYYNATRYFKQLTDNKDNASDRGDMLSYLNGLNLTTAQRDAMWSTFGTTVYTPYDSSNGIYGKYESYGKPAGITPEVFATFYDTCNAFTGTKDKNGKTISGSKQKKVIKYINDLNLSKAQKDALYLSMYKSKKSDAWKTRPWR